MAFSPVERAAGASPDTPPETTKAMASALATSSGRTRLASTRCSWPTPILPLALAQWRSRLASPQKARRLPFFFNPHLFSLSSSLLQFTIDQIRALMDKQFNIRVSFGG